MLRGPTNIRSLEHPVYSRYVKSIINSYRCYIEILAASDNLWWRAGSNYDTMDDHTGRGLPRTGTEKLAHDKNIVSKWMGFQYSWCWTVFIGE